MSLESTKNVKRANAVMFLQNRGVMFKSNKTTEELENLMYKHRTSIFENYWVYNKDEEHIIDDDKFSDWSYNYLI